jgi:hypothetical protein
MGTQVDLERVGFVGEHPTVAMRHHRSKGNYAIGSIPGHRSTDNINSL